MTSPAVRHRPVVASAAAPVVPLGPYLVAGARR